MSNESKRTREKSSGRGPRGVPLPVAHPPLVVEAPLGLVHLPLNAGGEPARDEFRLVLRRRARRQPGLVVHVRQPAVPLGGHGGRVVVVQVFIFYPSMTTGLVARVLEVLVAELVLADELALAGLELPVGWGDERWARGGGLWVSSSVRVCGRSAKKDGWSVRSRRDGILGFWRAGVGAGGGVNARAPYAAVENLRPAVVRMEADGSGQRSGRARRAVAGLGWGAFLARRG